MKSVQFIIEIFQKYPRLCIINILTSIMMSFVGALALLSLSPIIDMFLHQDGQGLSSLTLKVTAVMRALGIPATLPWEMGLMVFLVIAASAAQVLGNHVIVVTKHALHKDLMIGCFEDFFRAKWLFFSGNEQGKIFNTLNRELACVGDGLISIGGVFSNTAQIAVMALIPFFISWQVTLLAIACGGLLSWVVVMASRPIYILGRQNTETANVLFGMINEGISAAKLILGYGNREYSIRRLSQAYDEHLDCTVKFQILNYAVYTSYRPIGVLTVVVVLVASRYFAVPVSEITVLLLALFQMMNLFGSLVSQKNRIAYVVPGYEQIKSLRQRAREMAQVSGKGGFSGLSSGIKLDRIGYAYPGHEPVFTDIDIEIPKGKMVALVGRSGVGKSTLADIVLGLHQPTSGRVLVDGADLASLDINQYRSRVGYVPQESFLFNASIRENLLWAHPQATDAELEEACRLANSEEFILRLPQKYETVVGDRGVRLSGGQVQRMALARAILRRPDLLVLDEATSAVDSHSELLIQASIDKLARTTTIVAVAHRLSTIKKADYIYVMDKGKVVEEGTFDQLISLKGGEFLKTAEIQGVL